MVPASVAIQKGRKERVILSKRTLGEIVNELIRARRYENIPCLLLQSQIASFRNINCRIDANADSLITARFQLKRAGRNFFDLRVDAMGPLTAVRIWDCSAIYNLISSRSKLIRLHSSTIEVEQWGLSSLRASNSLLDG